MTTHTDIARQKRRWRAMLWSLATILVLAVALPSLGYLTVAAQNNPPERFTEDKATNPRSDTWREARDGTHGYTTASGPYVTDNLINNSGQNWRQYRAAPDNGNDGLSPLQLYGGWLIIASLIAVALVFAIIGQSKIKAGRSGETMVRWNLFDRSLHWFVAVTFILLGVTGLSLLFGRAFLIPLFGPAGFSAYAQGAMLVHNFVGPAFSVGLLLMIVLWAKENLINRDDIIWLRQLGGLIGKDSPPAGRMNGGHKLWFWLGVVFLGILVAVSGFVLDFPNFGQSRATMALAHVIHSSAAIIWIGAFFGHVYMGTIGTEGTLEGMTTGRVDANYVKQHHNKWYAELIQRGQRPQPERPKPAID